MKKRTKIILSCIVGLFFPFAFLYTLYLVFVVKEGNTTGKMRENTGIKQYTGVITEVGPSNSREGFRLEYTDQPTFVMMEDEEIRGLEVPRPLSSTFRNAFRKPATLFVYNNYIIGIQLNKGRTYCVSYDKGADLVALGWFFIICGIPLIAALGIGFLAIMLGLMMRKQGKIYLKANEIPDAIILTD